VNPEEKRKGCGGKGFVEKEGFKPERVSG